MSLFQFLIDYVIFMLPALIFSTYAQANVYRTFQRYSAQDSSLGLNGVDVARAIVERQQLNFLKFRKIPGKLTDNYNPMDRSINLSEASLEGRSLASIAVVAHELAHACQDRDNWHLFEIRQRAGLLAVLGSSIGWWLFLIGLVVVAITGGSRGQSIAEIGVLLLFGVVIFAIITLPVEINASQRAMKMLSDYQLITPAEEPAIRAVLGAAALTYVAGVVQAVSQFLFYIFSLRIFAGPPR